MRQKIHEFQDFFETIQHPLILHPHDIYPKNYLSIEQR